MEEMSFVVVVVYFFNKKKKNNNIAISSRGTKRKNKTPRPVHRRRNEII